MLSSISIKDAVESVSAVVATLGFLFGLFKFRDAIAIRRYEKFHGMSVRFDGDESIQAVCKLLNADIADESVNKQQKEVFICFLEEISFMAASGIMRKEVALYTFGYYARRAHESAPFWRGLQKDHKFYARFREFCKEATDYKPSSRPRAFRF